MALSGFSNPALALVVGALFIAAAMTHTGLDRRIALVTLAKVGGSTRRVLLGAMVVIVLLSLVVPSATARSACVVPIMMDVIAAFGVAKRSNIAAGIMIIVAQGTSIWNVGILASLAELGPMTGAQKRLAVVSGLLLLAWATEGKLHAFDTTSTTYALLLVFASTYWAWLGWM